MGLADSSACKELSDHLEDVGLVTDLKGLVGDNWTTDAILDHMGRDKKTEGGKLTFILARGIGKSFIANDVTPTAVADVVDTFIHAARP